MLVSNLGQTNGSVGSLGSFDQAQAFTTGDNNGGYTLTSVEIQTTDTPNLDRLTVSIRSDSSGSPDASLGTLTNPASLPSDGLAAFTASGAGIDLEKETTYFVLVDVTGGPGGNIQNTASDNEDANPATNWSIGDTSLYRNKGSDGSWTSFADSKKIRINGTLGGTTVAGVTVSETALTVTEQDTAGDTYTVVLDSEPTSSVTVAVNGTSGTDVTAAPASLTFTTSNWSTAKTVTVTADNDTNTADETVSLTHSATSSDSDYDGITIAGVDVMVEDNDTAKVTGVALTPGDGELAVAWTPVSNATGYQVQWKSGGQGYNNNSRRAVISSGSTASHTISSLTNGTTYTVRMRATRTGANHWRVFGRGDGRAAGGGRDGVGDGADGDGGEQQRGHLHGGARQRADVECHGRGRRAREHGRVRDPGRPDLHDVELEYGQDGDGDRRQRYEHRGRNGVSDPQRDQQRQRLRRHHDRRRDGGGGGQRHRKGDGGGAHAGRRGTRGGVDGGGQRHGLPGAVEVGRAELQQQRAAGHDQFGFDREPHDLRTSPTGPRTRCG